MKLYDYVYLSSWSKRVFDQMHPRTAKKIYANKILIQYHDIAIVELVKLSSLVAIVHLVFEFFLKHML
jgi:hypothetical protein